MSNIATHTNFNWRLIWPPPTFTYSLWLFVFAFAVPAVLYGSVLSRTVFPTQVQVDQAPTHPSKCCRAISAWPGSFRPVWLCLSITVCVCARLHHNAIIIVRPKTPPYPTNHHHHLQLLLLQLQHHLQLITTHPCKFRRLKNGSFMPSVVPGRKVFVPYFVPFLLYSCLLCHYYLTIIITGVLCPAGWQWRWQGMDESISALLSVTSGWAKARAKNVSRGKREFRTRPKNCLTMRTLIMQIILCLTNV